MHNKDLMKPQNLHSEEQLQHQQLNFHEENFYTQHAEDQMSLQQQSSSVNFNQYNQGIF